MGARRSMNTKGDPRKILSTLHPNTILKHNLDSNAHPNHANPLDSPSMALGVVPSGTGPPPLTPPNNQ